MGSTAWDGQRRYFVYRAFDRDSRALYVGITRNLDGRWRNHRAERLWSQFATRFRVSGPYPEMTARRLERDEIRRLVPHFNRSQNPGLRRVFEQDYQERVRAWTDARERARADGVQDPRTPYPSYKFDTYWCDRYYRRIPA